MSGKYGFLAAVFWLVASTLPTASAQPGYMEAGVALVGQVSADYRGSAHYQPQAVPLPYFLYQGRIIKADEDGLRGEFWANHRFEFNVSVDGSLNGRSDNNVLRAGMRELDSAFETGPSFNINISGDSFRDGWSVRFPVRAVFTVGTSGIDYIGYLFNPRLTWRASRNFWDWETSFNAGLLFADKTYHRYYYDVAADFVTEQRPYYSADGGYSGAFTRLAFYRRLENWRFGISLRYDNLSGAEFGDSPLVETNHFGSISFGLIRTLWTN